MGIQGFVKISFVALGLLSMAMWVPHMYSFMRTLFMVYLPSVVSAVIAPKCLFVFSNIIVVFLVGESKLGHHPMAEDNVAAVVDGSDMVQEKEGGEEVLEAALAMPVITGDDQCEQLQDEEFVVLEEQVDAFLASEGVEIDQIGDEGHDLAVGEVVANMMRKEEEGVDDHLVLADEDVLLEEEGGRREAQEAPEERDDLPPADELNRRVEEFIAMFNMERQLEARMLVCCC